VVLSRLPNVGIQASGADFLELSDDKHSDQEDRMIAIGVIKRGVIMVVFTEQSDDTIRIMSARKATKEEIHLYRQHLGDAT
jgi:uncharacterized DUF497 family protein